MAPNIPLLVYVIGSCRMLNNTITVHAHFMTRGSERAMWGATVTTQPALTGPNMFLIINTTTKATFVQFILPTQYSLKQMLNSFAFQSGSPQSRGEGLQKQML